MTTTVMFMRYFSWFFLQLSRAISSAVVSNTPNSTRNNSHIFSSISNTRCAHHAKNRTKKRAPFGRSTYSYSLEARTGLEPRIRKIFAEHHHSCCEGLYALFQACLSQSCRAALEWLQVPSNPFLSFQQVPSARTFASSITLATRQIPLFRNGCVYEI